MVENARIYYDGVKEWRRKDTAEKMWESFRTFFAREFREIRVQPQTSASERCGTNSMRGGHTNATEREKNVATTGGSAREFSHSNGSR